MYLPIMVIFRIFFTLHTAHPTYNLISQITLHRLKIPPKKFAPTARKITEYNAIYNASKCYIFFTPRAQIITEINY